MNKQIKNISVAVLTALIAFYAIGFAQPSVRGDPEAPTITLTPPAGPVKIPVAVKGTGFTPGATVDLNWFGFIIDIPGIKGHVGYYPIKTGVIVGSDGSFTTTIIVPYDFSDVTHFVNATQNGVGTGIMNATFTIAPIQHLAPQPANYTEGQEVLLHVYGGPLGTPAFMMKLSPFLTIIKFTYDNAFWGYATSHLETEGPIVTGGFIGGDIGGNITIRFKAVGGVGKHAIRGYVGEKETPPYLSCEIGGEAVFYIVGPGLDTQTIINKLASLIDAEIASLEGDVATVKTSIGTIDGRVTSVNNGVATIQTNLGTLNLSVDKLKGSTDSLSSYDLGILGLSVINLIILLVVVARLFRKT